jgi:multidrug efflux pump subunit AcrA (membrane-fusion protein)
VERIDPEADSTTGLYRTIVTLGGDSDLRPGVYVEAQVLVDDRDDVVSVPMEVLRREGGKDYVFVVSGDVVEKRSVQIGGSQGGMVEIPSRLYPGEKLVIEGVESLYDGARIWVQDDGAASSDEGTSERP